MYSLCTKLFFYMSFDSGKRISIYRCERHHDVWKLIAVHFECTLTDCALLDAWLEARVARGAFPSSTPRESLVNPLRGVRSAGWSKPHQPPRGACLCEACGVQLEADSARGSGPVSTPCESLVNLPRLRGVLRICFCSLRLGTRVERIQ